MGEKTSCPYCGSPKVRVWDALVTVRVVESPEGGPGVEKKCPVYRCAVCGRSFDELEVIEAEEDF